MKARLISLVVLAAFAALGCQSSRRIRPRDIPPTEAQQSVVAGVSMRAVYSSDASCFSPANQNQVISFGSIQNTCLDGKQHLAAATLGSLPSGTYHICIQMDASENSSACQAFGPNGAANGSYAWAIDAVNTVNPPGLFGQGWQSLDLGTFAQPDTGAPIVVQCALGSSNNLSAGDMVHRIIVVKQQGHEDCMTIFANVR